MKTHQHKVSIAASKRILYIALFQGIILLIGTLFSISLSAQSSQKLSFQGYLESSDGTPLDGDFQLTFTIYMSETSTRPLWQESQDNVNLDRGVFSVILGNVTEMYVDFESEVWLGVQLGNETEFSPRSRMTSVPHAFSSDYSHGMYGNGNVMPGDGMVGIGTIDPKEALEVVGTIKATKFVGDGSELTNISGGSSVWNKSEENINYTAGFVGVMNEDPQYALDASGNIRARSALIAGSTVKDGEVYIRDISNAAQILLKSNGDSYLKGGNVGFMNEDPIYAVDASGNIRARSALIAGSTAKDGEVYIRDITNTAQILLKSNGDSYLKGGNVGFMNEDPIYAVDASGNIRARSALIAGSTAKDGEVYIRDISNTAQILLRSKGDSYLKGGNVGIMNDDPKYGLDVSGNVRARSDLIAGSTAKDGSVYIRDIADNNKILLRSNGDSYFSGGKVGINTTSPDYQLDVNGVIRGTNVSASDERWKKNIRQIDGALAIVSEMRGVRYDWKVEEFEEMNFSNDPQVGLIAQEVEKILPELVFTGVDGYKSVNYTQLTAVLLEAIKEQQIQILSMQEQMKGIVNSVAQLEKKSETNTLADSSNSLK